MENKIIMNRKTIPITIAVPTLDRWLRYYYVNHHINEVIISIDKTNTIMSIMLKNDDFSEIPGNHNDKKK